MEFLFNSALLLGKLDRKSSSGVKDIQQSIISFLKVKIWKILLSCHRDLQESILCTSTLVPSLHNIELIPCYHG